MKLFNKDKKPIESVQLSTGHIALRWIAVAVCLIVAVASIGYALNALLTVNAGWQEIEHISSGLTCADDFVVSFNFGKGGAEATGTYRRIVKLYSDTAEKAYWLFTKDQAHESIVGMYAINHAPNTVLTVDPVLYNAFAQVQAAGDRSIYLAPLYAEHDSMLASGSDVFAAMRDPARDDEAAEFAARVAMYANDPQHIQVELLGNDQVRLHVSEEYLNWAEANAFDALVDFHWMKNAFIIDYFADVLTENGFCDGVISGKDGFVRNLGAQDTMMFNVYDHMDGTSYRAAVMEYRGAKSIISLRSFPVSQSDAQERYYIYDDGSVAAPHMNAQSGLRATAFTTLIGYDEEAGCAETLLKLLPIYTMEIPGVEDARRLVQEGIELVWCDGHTVYHTEEALSLVQLYDGEVTYAAERFE